MSVSIATATLAATDKMPDLSSFGHDPFWMIVLKTIGIFSFMSQRPDPHRVGVPSRGDCSKESNDG